MVLPSLKEGWGLVVGEAAAHRTPTVAYASAGGTRESIVDGVSGVLVDTQAELTSALGALLRDAEDAEPSPRAPCGTARASPGDTRSRPSRTSSDRRCGASWSATRTSTED